MVRSIRERTTMRQVPPVGQIERGTQAGIEPATAARATQHIGSAKAVRNMSTPVHHLMPTSP